MANRYYQYTYAGVSELVYEIVSNTIVLTGVWVQLPPPAQKSQVKTWLFVFPYAAYYTSNLTTFIILIKR